MKLFGEYLVEKGIVNEDQILDALIEQLDAQPSVVKVVADLKMLDRKDILRILNKQAIAQTSFIQAAESLSLWSPEHSKKLFSQIAHLRKPLGEILVQRKALDLSTLTRSLDEFFADRSREPSPAPGRPQEVPAKRESIPIKAPLVSAPSGALIYSDFFEFLGNDFFSVLERAVLASSKEKIEDPELWRQFYNEVHKLRGAAKLSDFKEMFELTDKIEQMLRELVSRKPENLGSEISQKLHFIVKNCQQIFTAAAALHQANSWSPDFFSKGEIAEKIQALPNWLTDLVFYLYQTDGGNH